MSIVTLKRKSQAIHSDVSKGIFNINGVLRLPPPTLIRSPTYTRMKENSPIGHGTGSHCRVKGIQGKSCKNEYPIVIHRTDCYTQQGVKKSTKSNKAMLDTRFVGIFHGSYPKSVHGGFPSKTNSDVIQESARNTMKCLPLVGEVGQTNCVVSKNINKYKVTYSEYLLKLTSQCVKEPLPVKIWHTNTLIGFSDAS